MMKFEKGKLYTVVGVDSLVVNPDGCFAELDQNIDVNDFDKEYAECVSDNNYSVDDCDVLISVGVKGDGSLYTDEVLGLVECYEDDFDDDDDEENE